MSAKYIIGIDGGASKTRGIIFNSLGETITHQTTIGSNLAIDEENSSNRVVNLINSLLNKAKIETNNISAIGIA